MLILMMFMADADEGGWMGIVNDEGGWMGIVNVLARVPGSLSNCSPTKEMRRRTPGRPGVHSLYKAAAGALASVYYQS